MIAASDLWVAPPGGPAVVRGLSLRVEDGEWLAITGPNGSGKSTLALALAGLVAPSRGSVVVDGAALPASPEGRQQAAIASVLQEPAAQLLEPSVADELAFTARNLGLDEPEVRRRVEEWSCRLGLESELRRDPRTLSAGRQQLTLLGAALAARPRLLVVDEGGAHWDTASRRRALEAVRREASQGLTVVWVTQEPAELEAADRTLTLAAPTLEPLRGSETGPGTAAGLDGDGVLTVGGDAMPSVRVDVSAWDGQEARAVRTPNPISFECAAGRPVAVSGPNGAGKTVLLEAAAGLHPIPQVRITWNGPDRRPILAGQHPELEVFADTVGEEMTFAARSRGVPRDQALREAASALSALGYRSETLGRRVWELSSGERRLVQVLAATVTPASLVVLDEPTSGLDSVRRSALAEWVRRRAGFVPLIAASQDAEWVARIGAENVLLHGYVV